MKNCLNSKKSLILKYIFIFLGLIFTNIRIKIKIDYFLEK